MQKDKYTKPRMKIPAIIVFVFGIIVAFFAFNNFIYNQKQGSGEPIAPYKATLTGEYVCLPHRDTRGPQTLECAFGLKTASGEHYALDFGEKPPTDFRGGQTVTLSGTITPLESLSTDQWQKYAIEGIFSVIYTGTND